MFDARTAKPDSDWQTIGGWKATFKEFFDVDGGVAVFIDRDNHLVTRDASGVVTGQPKKQAGEIFGPWVQLQHIQLPTLFIVFDRFTAIIHRTDDEQIAKDTAKAYAIEHPSAAPLVIREVPGVRVPIEMDTGYVMIGRGLSSKGFITVPFGKNFGEPA